VVQDTEDAQGMLMVYMDTIHGLGNAIQGKPKKIFHLQKLGSTVVFAVDESRRLLAVYASSEVGFDMVHSMVINFSLDSRANHSIHLRRNEQQSYRSRWRNQHHTMVRYHSHTPNAACNLYSWD
jgi:hypothetical protein